ncbi:alpha/beta fold hydrolase [Labrys sp. KNU-23]|nr:alpha/beta fold hydrolase [Labrys sp. KNU-23]QEN89240.1 alpha/beta fold hydrolase [Labrys sp. KNU-23]
MAMDKAVEPVAITCRDGVVLAGHFWPFAGADSAGTVIVNAATGVLARYYHRYARFLAEQGFDAITYDYRGIGLSRPHDIRRCGYRWREWGSQDFEAVLQYAGQRRPGRPLFVVGHSIGGFLPGFAGNAASIDRMLTVGAQYAYWPDYAHGRRLRLLWRWHVLMPLLTAICGYFPGRRLGWLEDLPAGIALEWSFRRRRVEDSHPRRERGEVLARFAAVSAPILAVTASDDEFGTVPAVRRALAYYSSSAATAVRLLPQDYGLSEIGHFSLFHDRHRAGFWRDTLAWLRDGVNPWPHRRFETKG